MMRKIARDQIVSELRSGKYRQSHDMGKTEDGALSADVVAMQALGQHFPTAQFEDAPAVSGATNREWQDLLGDLISRGAAGATFTELADHIENNYPVTPL